MFFVQYVQTQYFQSLIYNKKADSDNLIGIKPRKQDIKTDRHIPLCAEKQAKPPFRRPFRLQRAQKKLPEQRLGVAVPTA
jgi:hypothetical protein